MSERPLSPEVLVPRFGEHLVEKGVISAKDLERALQYQEKLRSQGEDRLIGQVLIDLGIINTATREAVITEMIIQLRVALQEANQSLEAANQQLEQRVIERTAELQRALEKLSEINQLKANIVANISHELRTPLTHLKGYLELLLAGDLGPITEQQQLALSTIGRSSERLSRLIDDLILFSVSERDQMQLRMAAFKIKDLCASAIQKVEAKAKERGIKLVNDCKDDSDVEGDEEKIGWVVNQFLDNAIKFTQQGGTVTLRTKREDWLTDIIVLDTGMGIPDTRKDEIFDSFYQLDGSSTRRVGGTGLGLALAKRIIEAHGSVIRVNSEVGKGSCFAFSLKVNRGNKPNSSF